jgi:hypothetical protein
VADLTPPTVSTERIREAVEDVFAHPDFVEPQPGLLERIQTWIWDQLTQLFLLLFRTGRGSVIGAVVLLAVVGVLMLLAVRFARTVRREPQTAAAVEAAIGRSAADWLDEAARHERAGRTREALRCHYRALVADLAGAGVVEEVAGRTAGEYLAAVQADLPAAAVPFGLVTDAFQRAWYGAAPVAWEHLTAVRSAADDTRAAAGVAARHARPLAAAGAGR